MVPGPTSAVNVLETRILRLRPRPGESEIVHVGAEISVTSSPSWDDCDEP